MSTVRWEGAAAPCARQTKVYIELLARYIKTITGSLLGHCFSFACLGPFHYSFTIGPSQRLSLSIIDGSAR